MTQLFRFLVVGAVVATVNLTALYLLTAVIGVWYIYSAAVAFGCAFGVSFLLQKFWTFGDASLGGVAWQLPSYLALQLFNLCLNLFGLVLLVQYAHIWYLLAQIVVLALIAVWTFLVSKYILFKRPRHQPRNWIEFWSSENNIYVSPEHVRIYYQTLARDLLDLGKPKTLLDWGCGYALGTPIFTSAGIEVYLYDPVLKMQKGAQERFGGDPRVHIVTDYTVLRNIEEILIFSVFQYLSKEEARKVLLNFRAILCERGVLYLGDIIPPNKSMIEDVLALLKLAIQNGFFFRAFFSMTKTFFSDYRKIRKRAGLSTYTSNEMISLLKELGFEGQELPNISYCKHRMLFRAYKRL